MVTQGQITYVFRGKEMTFEFYPVQPLERLGLRMRGERKIIGDGYRFTFSLTPTEEIVLRSVSVDISLDVNGHSKVFCNGFQSWSESREYDLHEKIPRLRWPGVPVNWRAGERIIRPSLPDPGCLHSWTYTYVRHADGNITLCGSVSERPGYTLFELDVGAGILRVSRDCEGRRIAESYVALDIVVLPGREDEVFDAYFQEVNASGKRGGKPAPPPVSGWYGSRNRTGDISEPVVLASLWELKKRDVPLDFFMVGDGWQRETGDWLKPSSGFPGGMKRIAAAAKEAGYKPGIWIAPYVCGRWSEVFRRHREWLLRDERGAPVKAGWNRNWGGYFYVLDIYNPGVRGYLREVFDTALQDWGFDVVAADFLYAAGLKPRERKTRGEAMCDGLDFLREIAGDKVLVAGAVPLGAAFGSADYCMTGSDISMGWEDFLGRLLGVRERHYSLGALTSMVGRHHLGGRAFAAAGSALSLDPAGQKMTPEQLRTLLRLSLLFSETFFVSDNPAVYSPGELAEYRAAFPVKPKKVLNVRARRGALTVYFEIDGRQYVLLANLSPRPREFRVEPSLYFDPSIPGFKEYEEVGYLEPYESRCLLRVPSADWAVAGGTGHVFPGCEVLAVRGADGAAEVAIHPHARSEGDVFLRVPEYMDFCVVNGRRLKVEKSFGLAFVRLRVSPGASCRKY